MQDTMVLAGTVTKNISYGDASPNKERQSIGTILRNLIGLPRKPSVLIISHDARALKQVDLLYRLKKVSLHTAQG